MDNRREGHYFFKSGLCDDLCFRLALFHHPKPNGTFDRRYPEVSPEAGISTFAFTMSSFNPRRLWLANIIQ